MLFRRVSVFAGGFDLAAVSAVCTDGDDGLNGVRRLVDTSLLIAVDTPAGTRAAVPHEAGWRLASVHIGPLQAMPGPTAADA